MLLYRYNTTIVNKLRWGLKFVKNLEILVFYYVSTSRNMYIKTGEETFEGIFFKTFTFMNFSFLSKILTVIKDYRKVFTSLVILRKSVVTYSWVPKVGEWWWEVGRQEVGRGARAVVVGCFSTRVSQYHCLLFTTSDRKIKRKVN